MVCNMSSNCEEDEDLVSPATFVAEVLFDVSPLNTTGASYSTKEGGAFTFIRLMTPSTSIFYVCVCVCVCLIRNVRPKKERCIVYDRKRQRVRSSTSYSSLSTNVERNPILSFRSVGSRRLFF